MYFCHCLCIDAAVVVVGEDAVSTSLQKMRETAFNRVREQNIKIQVHKLQSKFMICTDLILCIFLD